MAQQPTQLEPGQPKQNSTSQVQTQTPSMQTPQQPQSSNPSVGTQQQNSLASAQGTTTGGSLPGSVNQQDPPEGSKWWKWVLLGLGILILLAILAYFVFR